MARFTVDVALGTVLECGADEFDSGGEEEIDEDPEFPLPSVSEDEESDHSSQGGSSDEGMHFTSIQRNYNNNIYIAVINYAHR